MKGTLYGVGVGPGDPELMTLKAVRMIRENEIIAVPGADVKETVAYKIAAIDGNKAVLVLAGRDDHVLTVYNDGIADGKLRNVHHIIDVIIIDCQGDLRLTVFFGNVLRAEACCDGRVGQCVQVKAFRQRLDALCFLRGLLCFCGLRRIRMQLSVPYLRKAVLDNHSEIFPGQSP